MSVDGKASLCPSATIVPLQHLFPRCLPYLSRRRTHNQTSSATMDKGTFFSCFGGYYHLSKYLTLFNILYMAFQESESLNEMPCRCGVARLYCTLCQTITTHCHLAGTPVRRNLLSYGPGRRNLLSTAVVKLVTVRELFTFTSDPSIKLSCFLPPESQYYTQSAIYLQLPPFHFV